MSCRLISRTVSRYSEAKLLRLRQQGLTEVQQSILDFMRAFLAENDTLPSNARIAEEFGWPHASNAQYHVTKPVKLNRLEANSAGGLRFVRSEKALPNPCQSCQMEPRNPDIPIASIGL
jgi:hypothetical protein